MTRKTILLIALSLLVTGLVAHAQDPEPPQVADSAPPARLNNGAGQRGFVNSLFFTMQYGGGVMLSTGGGVAFFDNVVRPELLVGYTPSGQFQDLSLSAKLNARILGIPAGESVGIFGTIGTNFTFFSSDNRIVSSAFLAQEVDIREILGLPTVSLYIEEHLFFVATEESNVVFQLAIGTRVSLF